MSDKPASLDSAEVQSAFSLFVEFLSREGADSIALKSETLLEPFRNCLERASGERGALWNGAGDFALYLAARLPGYRTVEKELSQCHAGDLLLAQRCSQGSEAAMLCFASEFHPVMRSAAGRLKMDRAASDELVQQVQTKLMVPKRVGEDGKISHYAGAGALRSWVYASALRHGLNELRRQGRAPVAAGDESLLVAMPDKHDDQELQYMKSLYRDAFDQAFRLAIAQMPTRLGNILRHYYLDELTLDEIGRLYQVHKSTAMRWLNKAHSLLESEIKREMTRKMQLGPGEVESILRMIQSGIQLGLASVLASPDSET